MTLLSLHVRELITEAVLLAELFLFREQQHPKAWMTQTRQQWHRTARRAGKNPHPTLYQSWNTEGKDEARTSPKNNTTTIRTITATPAASCRRWTVKLRRWSTWRTTSTVRDWATQICWAALRTCWRRSTLHHPHLPHPPTLTKITKTPAEEAPHPEGTEQPTAACRPPPGPRRPRVRGTGNRSVEGGKILHLTETLWRTAFPTISWANLKRSSG